MGNLKRNVIYTGITSNLIKRVWEHKTKLVGGFTQRYNVVDLVYYEIFETPTEAIEREKQIKSWSRKRKDVFIQTFNPTLKDLSDNINSW
jgi:putative endonuclease